MMKYELIDRLQALNVKLLNDTIGNGDYEILERCYIALDLDKDVFAKIVSVVGIETLIVRHAHAAEMVTALVEYRKREEYKRNKLKLEEMARETDRLQELVKAYEKAQVF